MRSKALIETTSLLASAITAPHSLPGPHGEAHGQINTKRRLYRHLHGLGLCWTALPTGSRMVRNHRASLSTCWCRNPGS